VHSLSIKRQNGMIGKEMRKPGIEWVVICYNMLWYTHSDILWFSPIYYDILWYYYIHMSVAFTCAFSRAHLTDNSDHWYHWYLSSFQVQTFAQPAGSATDPWHGRCLACDNTQRIAGIASLRKERHSLDRKEIAIARAGLKCFKVV
jgi:hypothetical protein